MRYILRLAYVGTAFSGFQVQPDKRTVQGTLGEACAAYFGVPCFVTGCSRTDSGVHALDFHAILEVGDDCGRLPPPERLPFALRPYLPSDLSVLSATSAPDGFHIRHDVKTKEYRYFLHLGVSPNPFLSDRAWFYPGKLPDGYLARMREAAAYMVGTHDFSAFMAQGSSITDCTRTIYSLTVSEQGEYLTVSVVGNGFLYNMVRIIVGTLMDVAEERILPSELPLILASCDRKRAGRTAPPHGLYLWKVDY